MQRAREFVRETSNTTLAVIVFAFVMTLMIVLPEVAPTSRFGTSCSALAHPIPGGNNQSLLAARSSNALQLQLDVPRPNIGLNEELVVNVTFHNTGVGPVTLFFVPEETLLRNDGAPGLSIEIVRLPDRAIFSEPATLRPPNPERQTFPVEVLHVLGPRQRCTESLTFTSARLANLNLQAGNYAMRAIYRNRFPGTLSVPPGATATPIFTTQGVYVTSELSSNMVEFSIGLVSEGQAQPLGG